MKRENEPSRGSRVAMNLRCPNQQESSVAIAEGKAGRTGGDRNGEPGARHVGIEATVKSGLPFRVLGGQIKLYIDSGQKFSCDSLCLMSFWDHQCPRHTSCYILKPTLPAPSWVRSPGSLFLRGLVWQWKKLAGQWNDPFQSNICSLCS